MMLVWSSLAAVLASCWNRLTTCASWEISGGRTLIATSRSSVRSWARNTAPMPPLPSKRSSLYLPSTIRCRRVSRSWTWPLVVAFAPPPVWSAPQAKQNLLLSGSGVWQRTHSKVELDGLVTGRSVARDRRARGLPYSETPPEAAETSYGRNDEGRLARRGSGPRDRQAAGRGGGPGWGKQGRPWSGGCGGK